VPLASEPERLPQYMLLSGKFFIDSESPKLLPRHRKIPSGDVFPNIFYYDHIKAGGKIESWHGLSGLRILQLANFRELHARDLLFVLHNIFGYELNIVVDQVEEFVAFGLLEVIWAIIYLT
jgi:hypothetical protein